MYQLMARQHAAEICAFLDNHSIFNGNFLLTFRDNLSVPSSVVYLDSWPLKMGPISLSRNVGKELPLYAV